MHRLGKKLYLDLENMFYCVKMCTWNGSGCDFAKFLGNDSG